MPNSFNQALATSAAGQGQYGSTGINWLDKLAPVMDLLGGAYQAYQQGSGSTLVPGVVNAVQGMSRRNTLRQLQQQELAQQQREMNDRRAFGSMTLGKDAIDNAGYTGAVELPQWAVDTVQSNNANQDTNRLLNGQPLNWSTYSKPDPALTKDYLNRQGSVADSTSAAQLLPAQTQWGQDTSRVEPLNPASILPAVPAGTPAPTPTPTSNNQLVKLEDLKIPNVWLSKADQYSQKNGTRLNQDAVSVIQNVARQLQGLPPLQVSAGFADVGHSNGRGGEHNDPTGRTFDIGLSQYNPQQADTLKKYVMATGQIGRFLEEGRGTSNWHYHVGLKQNLAAKPQAATTGNIAGAAAPLLSGQASADRPEIAPPIPPTEALVNVMRSPYLQSAVTPANQNTAIAAGLTDTKDAATVAQSGYNKAADYAQAMQELQATIANNQTKNAIDQQNADAATVRANKPSGLSKADLVNQWLNEGKIDQAQATQMMSSIDPMEALLAASMGMGGAGQPQVNRLNPVTPSGKTPKAATAPKSAIGMTRSGKQFARGY